MTVHDDPIAHAATFASASEADAPPPFDTVAEALRDWFHRIGRDDEKTLLVEVLDEHGVHVPGITEGARW